MHFFRKRGKIVKTAAVICEYNPLHLGHIRQFRAIRDDLGADARIVCLMSGSYVQRGAPAVFSAPERAQAAVLWRSWTGLESWTYCASAANRATVIKLCQLHPYCAPTDFRRRCGSG